MTISECKNKLLKYCREHKVPTKNVFNIMRHFNDFVYLPGFSDWEYAYNECLKWAKED